jgi:peptidoglycan hydrolase CwlO-like protein
MFTDYDPYDQLQQLIAQCNENTRMIHKLIESHNKLDGIVMELTAQHSRTTELLLQTRTDIGTLTDEIVAIRSTDYYAPE